MVRGLVPSVLLSQEAALSRFFSRRDCSSLLAPSFPLATFEALREDRVMEVVCFSQLPGFVTTLVIEGDMFMRSCDKFAKTCRSISLGPSLSGGI